MQTDSQEDLITTGIDFTLNWADPVRCRTSHRSYVSRSINDSEESMGVRFNCLNPLVAQSTYQLYEVIKDRRSKKWGKDSETFAQNQTEIVPENFLQYLFECLNRHLLLIQWYDIFDRSLPGKFGVLIIPLAAVNVPPHPLLPASTGHVHSNNRSVQPTCSLMVVESG